MNDYSPSFTSAYHPSHTLFTLNICWYHFRPFPVLRFFPRFDFLLGCSRRPSLCYTTKPKQKNEKIRFMISHYFFQSEINSQFRKKKLLSRKSLENPVPPSFPLKFIHYDLLLWRTFYFLDQAQVEACFSLTLQFWSGYHHPAELKSFREIWKLYQAFSS